MVAITTFGVLVASASALAEPVVSGRLFYNLTSRETVTNGVKANSSGAGVDITRIYLGVDNKFTDMISGTITLDFANAAGTTSNNQVFVKKAYVKFAFDPKLEIMVGEADLPWVPYIESLYGYRYFQSVLIDRTDFGTSTDWGIVAGGKLNSYLSYSVAAIHGSGYLRGTRGAEMDYEGRLSFKYNQWNFALGGYRGKFGARKGATFTAGSSTDTAIGPVRTATRTNILAGWKGDRLTAVVECFKADNYAGSNPVFLASLDTNEAEGISTFVNYGISSKLTVFVRYDHVTTDNKTGADIKNKFYSIGASYPVFRNIDLAVAYKNTNVRSVSGLVQTPTKTEEAGIWASFRF